MYKKRIICLTLLSVLFCVTVFCPVGCSAETVLTVDDLPDVGETLVIESDSVLTVNVDETAVIDGAVLQINGTDNVITKLKIVNNGELTIKSTQIGCKRANLTIQNMGVLTFKTVHLTVVSNSTLSVDNKEQCSMTDFSVEVYGGYAYLSNTGSLNVNNGYFKDQFDGTFISNYGEAELSECTFVANGAYGKIELFNSGVLQLRHGMFDCNYGGTVNLNSLTGTLMMNECSMDVSGRSQGQRSDVNLLIGNSTWTQCEFINNDGLINCLNTGNVSLINCTVYMPSINSSTILSSSGPMFFKNFLLYGSGSTSITNWDSMTFVDSSCNSSHSLTLMNNGKLTAEHWFVKTTSNTARIVVYNGNNGSITFDVPFIEDVSISDLTSIGPDGQEFVESTGGTITVTNMNSIVEASGGGLDSTIIILAVVIVAIIALFVVGKKVFRGATSKEFEV